MHANSFRDADPRKKCLGRAVSPCNRLQLRRNMYSLTPSAALEFIRRYLSFTTSSELER